MPKSNKIAIVIICLVISFSLFFNSKDLLGGRTESFWNSVGTYLQTDGYLGYDILINGLNKYLNFNTISGESGYGIRDNGGTIEVKSSGGSWGAISSGGGEVNDGVNIGTGAGVFYGKSGVNLQFKSLKQGSNITISSTSNEITINSTATGGSGATTTINGASGPNFNFSTTSTSNLTISIATSSGTLTFIPGLAANYSIPLTASSTNWTTSYNIVNASSTKWDSLYTASSSWNTAYNSRITSTSSNLQFVGNQLSVMPNYAIPLSASATNWTTAYNTVNSSSTKWDTAYSWGNHASAGYLTSNSIINVSKLSTSTNGYVLQSVNNNAAWVSTSSLGIAGGSSQWSNNASGINYNSGNVGIGTSTPGQLLSVYSNTTSSYVGLQGASDGYNYAGIELMGPGTPYVNAKDWQITHNLVGDLVFNHFNGTDWLEAPLTISNSNQVYIPSNSLNFNMGGATTTSNYELKQNGSDYLQITHSGGTTGTDQTAGLSLLQIMAPYGNAREATVSLSREFATWGQHVDIFNHADDYEDLWGMRNVITGTTSISKMKPFVVDSWFVDAGVPRTPYVMITPDGKFSFNAATTTRPALAGYYFASSTLLSYFDGGIYNASKYYDASGATGTNGQVLWSTGTSTKWVATSSLGITSTGSAGATTTINGVNGPNFTFSTTTASNLTITIATSTGTLTFTPGVAANYSIPLTASSTNWNTSYNTVTANSANWTSAYNTVNASSTKWDTAYGWGNHASAGYLTSSALTPYLTQASASSSFPTFSYASSTYLNSNSLLNVARLSTSTSGYVLQSNGNTAAWVATSTLGLGGGVGATTFLGLTDTPSTYSGSGGLCVKVNSGATALEFGACAAGGSQTPWTSDINAADYDLYGVGQLAIGTSTYGTNLVTVRTSTQNPALVIDSSGNVIFGSSTPGEAAGINANYSFVSNSGADASVLFENKSAGVAEAFAIKANSEYSNLRFINPGSAWYMGTFGGTNFSIFDDSGAGLKILEIESGAKADSIYIQNDGTIRLNANSALAFSDSNVSTSSSDFLGFIAQDGTLSVAIPSKPNSTSISAPLRIRIDEPATLPCTGVANFTAQYSDDVTRILTHGTGASGAVSLHDSSLSSAVTAGFAVYNSGNTLQTVTGDTIMNGGGVSVVRGAITNNGYHYAMVGSSTNPTYWMIKRATSSYATNIAAASSWATTTISGFNLNSLVVGIVGASENGNKIWIASSTTQLIPFTVSTSDNTLTAGTPVTISGAAMSITATRVNNNGIYANFSAAPNIRKYLFNGSADTTSGSRYASAPATTGPDFFAMQNSVYSLLGASQCGKRYGW